MQTLPIKRALISVSDKQGIVEFASALVRCGVEIISTGGTSQLLKEANIPFEPVESITQFPEMLNGRVKTLHPKIHGGILGKRDKHAEEALLHQIDWIDLVVVNFYPFNEAIQKNPNLSWDEIVEYIDIGGPTMVRAASKNFAWVGVVTDPSDYQLILDELHQHGGLSFDTRKSLAAKTFQLTASYDASIHQHFHQKSHSNTYQPNNLHLQFEKTSELRYGENPHQRASAYHLKNQRKGILFATQHQGKPLSYNNLLDAEAAFTCVKEFEAPTCVIVKHANPCGVASANEIESAYQRAFEADSLSAFGGIIALNRPCTAAIAKAITTIFMEVVLAPEFTNDALAILATKPNLRVLALPIEENEPWEMKMISGGLLLQEKNLQILNKTDLTIVTLTKPTSDQIDSMLFSWRVLKHIKSNGILIAKDQATVGIGAGQVSRIDAVDIAIRKATDKIAGSILASDAFFPFRDSIDRIADAGIKAIIQPGGSVRDEEVIAACNEHNMSMVFTGIRCFKH